jgi:pre-rRNA-processing protein TSR3
MYSRKVVKLLVYMLKQDDPKKCTAAKLVHFNLANAVRRIPRNSVVLNPYGETLLSKSDQGMADSITAIDCSWERASTAFKHNFHGISRKLPLLLAANPTNYSKLGKLSSAEALAGALSILGFDDLAFEVMNKFKWGHTFFELNGDLLKDYAKANDPEEIKRIEMEYFK